MKTNRDIEALLQRKQFDGVRYACIDRLKENPMDAQAWTFLGQAMVGLKRGRMAKLCFERTFLLEPFATWAEQALAAAASVGEGRDDKHVLALLELPHVPVSACMLTRNNSSTIRECLQALQGAVDEIVVVDTGSTDDTVSIVESLGIPVHQAGWEDDFATARNYALSLAAHDWIFSVDSDEILYPSDVENVHAAAALFDSDVYVLFVLQMNQIGASVTPYQSARMFRRQYFEWRNPIHEEPVLRPSAPVSVPKSLAVNIRLRHSGYDPSAVDLERKLQRNVAMLEKELESHPDDVNVLYYLGRELSMQKRFDEAVQKLELSYELGSRAPKAPLLPSIGGQLAYAYTMMNELERAITVLDRVIEDTPEHPDAWFSYGVLLLGTDKERARTLLMHAKELALAYRGLVNFDTEIATWKVDHALNQLASTT